MLLEERLEELKAEFGELDEPFQRYSLLLQLAAYAPQPPCDFTTDEHLFRGCQTKVWLSVRRMDGQPDIRITSDSMLLRGVGLVLMRLLNGLPPEEYQALARHSRLHGACRDVYQPAPAGDLPAAGRDRRADKIERRNH